MAELVRASGALVTHMDERGSVTAPA